ncbi:IS630 family transposase [Niveispirillum sp. SYP-B3756]|uniref:IS630 family transposase n=1 Tax=Niveispirillum sp. SYP-B3756 TaxID=2662178 RepID=UPI001290BB57|nr:IS630 family transposase [Niveispirillum sp. SYP-B3756]MQP68678.1 IS630 family transposase [Niveispirillum sp. SYP-B3756]
MGKAYSEDLRERVEARIAAGYSRRDAARHFGVSASFAVKLAQRVAVTGSVAPGRQGRPPGHGKLAEYLPRLIAWVEAVPDISMPELAAKLEASTGVVAHPASLSRALLKRRGLAPKKTLLASECERADVRKDRQVWRRHRQPRMREEPHRLVFIDETATTTKMTRARGRARRGRRLKARAPFGHWKTQTFIAALRCDGLTAPWLINQPMNRVLFETYVETQLAPTLRPGDVVILDNLSSHKSEKAKAIIEKAGAWVLFLPPYSPDLNPIEMAFAKLKAHLRRIGARTIDDLWRAIGNICDLYDQDECWNYFKAAGYASD